MLTLTLLLPSPALATTYVVDQSGAGDALTIADGIALLSDGDRLEIRAGEYDEPELYPAASGIEIVGAGADVTVVRSTARRGYGALRLSGGDAVSGLTLEVVNTTGIIDVRDTEPGPVTVSDMVFTANTYGIIGAGDDVDLIVENSTFIESSISAVHVYGTMRDVTVLNNLFIDNEFAFAVSGYGYPGCLDDVLIAHNTFLRSSTAGVSVTHGTDSYDGGCRTAMRVDVVNNVFVGASRGYARGYVITEAFTGVVSGNLLGTDTISYNNSVLNTVVANTDADPVFMDWSDDGDWTNDDLRLAFGSPGVDAGVEGYDVLGVDRDGTARPLDGDLDGTALPDAGAFELDLDRDDDGAADLLYGGTDCDDTDAATLPGAADACGDGRDQDCDGVDPECPDTGDTGDTGAQDSGGGDSGADDGGDTDATDDTAADGDPSDDGDPRKAEEGCGCASAPSPTGAGWVLGLIGLVAARRARRRRG